MADWNSDLYRRFEDERTRPALDLLQRVALDAPRAVIDLGCGPGNSTELLVTRFPKAAISGIDTSDDMLKSARVRLPQVRFDKGDIAEWRPTTSFDLIYANAALHWIPGHGELIPRLFDALAPGGVLAIQMPDNWDEPSHVLMRETALAGPWKSAIEHLAAVRARILPPGDYYDILVSRAAHVDVWRTTYYHPMDSAAAIVDWVRATGLKPFIDPLNASDRKAYLALYEKKIAAAYPVRSSGKALLAFPRLFVVTSRKA